MFDGKIDFMDFNKIKINYGGKLTCRKVFKKKYILFLLFSILLIIILICIYARKKSQISEISILMKQLENEKSQIENSLNMISTQNQEEQINYSKLINEINIMDEDVKQIEQRKKTIEDQNSEIISQRKELEEESAELSQQLKTEMELKEDVYDKKISSLTELLESLQKEYQKLLEQKNGQKKESSIESSKIISSIEAMQIEKMFKATIKEKCFDGIEDQFSPEAFHKRCDKNPVLVLIKTDRDERIGAFTKASFDGFAIKRDPSTALFNIDKGDYYPLASPEYSTIVCDPNELPQFGVDLKIKSNGQGINSFPFNYGDKNENELEDLTKKEVFKIENLEIYTVELN